MTVYDSALRTNWLDESIWQAVPEVVPTLTGSASAQALSYVDMRLAPPDWPTWEWLVGPKGWRPEMGRPYMYLSGRCDSLNQTCLCSACYGAYDTPCICPRHRTDQPAGSAA